MISLSHLNDLDFIASTNSKGFIKHLGSDSQEAKLGGWLSYSTVIII